MTVYFSTGNPLDVAPPFRSYAMLTDEKTQGTDGGTFTANAWRVRDLTTQYHDPDGIVTLNNNIFVLTAGYYFIRFSAPAYKVTNHKAVLFRESGTQTVFSQGSSEFCTSQTAVGNRSEGIWRGQISGTVNLQIRHRCNDTQATNGFGRANGNGVELYTIVEIFKEF